MHELQPKEIIFLLQGLLPWCPLLPCYFVLAPLDLQSIIVLCNIIIFKREGFKLNLRGIEMKREDNRVREREVGTHMPYLPLKEKHAYV